MRPKGGWRPVFSAIPTHCHLVPGHTLSFHDQFLFFLLSFYDVAQAQDHSWSGTDPPWCWKFLGFWVSWVRPMGFSTPGYFDFTEMYGFEESSVGTYFPRKPPYSGISCLEIGQGPFPIQNQMQFKQLGKVCWGRGLLISPQ